MSSNALNVFPTVGALLKDTDTLETVFHLRSELGDEPLRLSAAVFAVGRSSTEEHAHRPARLRNSPSGEPRVLGPGRLHSRAPVP